MERRKGLGETERILDLRITIIGEELAHRILRASGSTVGDTLDVNFAWVWSIASVEDWKIGVCDWSGKGSRGQGEESKD